MEDCVKRQIELKAPVSRVWRALTDHREFGAWFRVAMDGPFVAGQQAIGRISKPGAGHLTMAVTVQRIEAERLLSFTWHPYAIDPAVDYSNEPPTLVEFTLEAIPGGTRLTVVESGFAALPAHRRSEAFLRNGEGWSIQMQNIAVYLVETP